MHSCAWQDIDSLSVRCRHSFKCFHVQQFNNHKKFLACYLDPKHKQLESFCLDTQPDQWLQLRCVQCVALTAIRQEVCTGIDFNRVQTLQMFLLSQATKMHFFSTWV